MHSSKTWTGRSPSCMRMCCVDAAGGALAEDLASESILAAVDHINAGSLTSIDVGYLIGIARHKLVDHWRRRESEQRHLLTFAGGRTDAPTDIHFEPGRASVVLSDLNPMQRAALTLRYVDDLPVSDVARLLGRSVHATETLLVAREGAFGSRTRRSRKDCHHDRPVRRPPPISRHSRRIDCRDRSALQSGVARRSAATAVGCARRRSRRVTSTADIDERTEMTVIPLRPNRRWTRPRLLAAACVVLVTGTVLALTTLEGSDADEPAPLGNGPRTVTTDSRRACRPARR